MTEQIIVGVGAVIALVVVLVLVGLGTRERGAPTPTVCAICRRPHHEKVDRFGQHVCEGFGRFSCCGYQSQMSSGADAFTHFCPPTIARERLAVEREMDRMRRGGEGEA